MSADWFCKIGEKKVGPLNNQQLKTFVAKGQLKPEHLVRRGSEGPWVPAGRIKGLFAAELRGRGQDKPAAAKPLPKAANAAPLPTAAESPPPPGNGSQASSGPSHKHHVQMNVNKFDIETTPVMVSRRKMKTGLKSLKESERKKATTILLSVIGGGLAIGVIVLVWAIANHKFSSSEPEDDNVAKKPPSAGSAVNPAPEMKPLEKKAAQAEWPTRWNKVSIEATTLGDVNIMVLKPLRGPPPPGIKTTDAEVLIVPVNLQLKQGAKKSVALTSWADEKLKKSVLLKDDEQEGKGNTYELLGLVPRAGDDASQVGVNKRIQLRLVFKMPLKMPKTMYVALPGAAVHADGTTIAYQFDTSEVVSEASKPAAQAAPASSPGSESAAAGQK